MTHTIDYRNPTSALEIACRKALLASAERSAAEYGLEMEPFTAWEDDGRQERVQGIFFKIKTDCGPWLIGAIVRKNDGELRLWPRNSERGPIQGSLVIDSKQFDDSVIEMVEKFTAA